MFRMVIFLGVPTCIGLWATQFGPTAPIGFECDAARKVSNSAIKGPSFASPGWRTMIMFNAVMFKKLLCKVCACRENVLCSSNFVLGLLKAARVRNRMYAAEVDAMHLTRQYATLC